jgi:hypothetical protein
MGARARRACAPSHRVRPSTRASVAKLVAKRKVIGPLVQRRVAPNTLLYYDRAVAWFFTYLQCLGHTVPKDEASFDELVAEAIEEAWGSGEGSFSRASVEWPKVLRACFERAVEVRLEPLEGVG